MTASFLIAFLTTFLSVAITGGIAYAARSSAPKHIDALCGVISPGKISALITVGVGILMMIAAFVVAIANPTPPTFVVTAMAFMLGGAIAGIMWPSLTSMHDVSWDATSITGASHTFGPTLGTKRTSIAWDAITKTGKTATGYWFVEAADGRKIYWSYLYDGYGALSSALNARAPDIELPSDMS